MKSPAPSSITDLISRQPLTVQEMLEHPLAGPEDLGRAIPQSVHATSVCLPTWQDVVDYEEGEARVRDRLDAGYPRFVYNSLVLQATAMIAERFEAPVDRVQLYPSRASAERAAYAIQSWSQAATRVEAVDARTWAVVHDAPDEAKAYWQHGGEGISSRHAEALVNGTHGGLKQLKGQIDSSDQVGQADADVLRSRIAEWMSVPADHVFLFGTGMAAIYALFRTVVDREEARGLPTIQFGFPYVDALKLQEKLRFNNGQSADPDQRQQKRDCLFYPTGDIDELNQDLRDYGRAAALFCEFPSNPLLACPDLPVLRGLGDLMGFPIFVDDTVGCCLNANLLPFADAVTMSLTKYFVGAGDATGGAVVIKPGGRMADLLLSALKQSADEMPHPADLAVLVERSTDLPERLTQINATTRTVVDFLRSHPAVQRVYYPDGYEAGWRCQDACGGLLSIDLVDATTNAPRFYDALEMCKGPNLGTSFSLCGAYTLLAHYGELDYVADCGVSPSLIRLSIGLEPEAELIQRLAKALDVCQMA